MLLQPLVENALSHGIGGRPGPGTLSLRAWRDNDRLWLAVEDDGVGLPAGGRRARESGCPTPAPGWARSTGRARVPDRASSQGGTRVLIGCPT